jgi:pimeloyl-ACP methyl ester carboxylesterase
MKAVASAGYRSIAPDMRGYGRSSAPPDATLYTPLQTAGDLVGLLDALKISSAVLVGHDWGATHAWNAALMRPDRFAAVFCLSVPYVPRGEVSVFERMRKSGHQDDFYMFERHHSRGFVLGIGFGPSRRAVESYGPGTEPSSSGSWVDVVMGGARLRQP